MIGNVRLKGCAPMGGWLTDFTKGLYTLVKGGAMSAAELLKLYQQGQLTTEQYTELEKARIEAESGKSSDNTKTILIVGGVALAALALGIIGTRNK